MKRFVPIALLPLAFAVACGDADPMSTGVDCSDCSTNNYATNNGGGYDAGAGNNAYYGNNMAAEGPYTSGNNTSAADPPLQEDTDGEAFDEWVENDWVATSTEPTSTFSIDVDNASYTWARRQLEMGQLPEPQSIRVEEWVNFFDYAYLEPTGDDPFAIDLEVSPSKFGPADSQLLRIGVKAKDVMVEDMKPSNIVLLVDTSGSMSSSDKLEMVKASIRGLLDNLRPTDTIGIVTYAGSSSIPLQPTPVSNRAAIEQAVDNMKSGGSTNGAAGIRTAYDLASDNAIEDGNNRVILMTDGDFNVGITGEALIDFINEQRASQIAITAVGYGLGNYKDYRMEQIAQNGNGNYFYCDTVAEAERIFGPELPSTIEIVASDVKLQVEFDPATVAEYRLIGYENRLLDNADFENDSVDAGDIGPGKRVTAFYEVKLQPGVTSGLLATGRTRYKEPLGETSQLFEQTIKMSSRVDFDQASPELRFGAAVVEFAEVLRGSQHVDSADLAEVKATAQAASYGTSKMAELIHLVEIAEGLYTPPATTSP